MKFLERSLTQYVKNFLIKNPNSDIKYLNFNREKFKVEIFIDYNQFNIVTIDIVIQSTVIEYENIGTHKRVFIYH